MTLSPGTRLGTYEITGPLGEGGMGEVYRARDTRLARDVAIKILPDSFASDPDRLMRFDREAKTLASLNHPHIAQIYGLEDRALVMELVEGEDLSQRIAGGPIPLEDALAMAMQIAEALEAAHEQGIIHRDLKPANIKLRTDGTVKVLDFGLAKAMDPLSGISSPDVAHRDKSPTITTPAMTLRGMIMGTAAYMAPEQAKGKIVDKRADVWAFGAVLYEMLTGSRVFDGEDVSETLASVLRSEIKWAALPSATPPAIVTLLKRCLERDPRRRVADMSTVRFVLNDAGTLTAPAEAARGAADLTARVAAEVNVARRRWLRRSVVPLVAALLIVTAIAGVAIARLMKPAPATPVTRFTVTPSEGQLLLPVRQLLTLSPDGTQLVFVAGGQLLIRRLSEFQSRVIPATDLGQNIISPVFSPDGQWIAFMSPAERLVKKVRVDGGPAVRVCDVPAPFGMSWHAAGILVGLGPGGIGRCNPSGGAREELLKVEEGEQAANPSLLPGGDALMFSLSRAADGAARWDKAQVVLQSLRTGTRKIVLAGGIDPKFAASGHLLYTSSGILFAAPFDSNTHEVRGEAVPVIDGIRRSAGFAQLAISNTGVAAYLPGPTVTNQARLLGIADRTGTISRFPILEGHYTHVRVSRDGTSAAIGTDDGKQAIIWTYQLGGTGALQRLNIEGNNRFPIWSPDGDFIAYQSDVGGQPGIYRQRVDGSGGVERLTSAINGETHIPESWSPDGRHLAFAVHNAQGYSLSILELPSKHIEAFAGVRSREPIDATFSPDGRWIAHSASPTEDLRASDRGVFVRPFPATTAVYQAPRLIVDFHPVWTRDGRELMYVTSATSGQMAAVSVNPAGGMTFGTPVRFRSTATGDRLSGEPRLFDVLPDGRLIGIVNVTDEQSRPSEIRVILNWFEELTQRVPPK